MHNDKPGKRIPLSKSVVDDMEGEMWEDIFGLDGYFVISNLGRIKRQRYEIQRSNGSVCVMAEKIIKPKVGKARNKFKNDYTYYIMGKVVIQGKDFSFSVARLVYYCFVQPFDLDDNSIVILCKDTDNLNIQPSNLILANLNQKRQRIVERKRFRSPLLDLAAEKLGTSAKA